MFIAIEQHLVLQMTYRSLLKLDFDPQNLEVPRTFTKERGIFHSTK